MIRRSCDYVRCHNVVATKLGLVYPDGSHEVRRVCAYHEYLLLNPWRRLSAAVLVGRLPEDKE